MTVEGAEESKVPICVVVVNYRTPSMVIDCLRTVVPQVRESGGRVALVDNASPDDSVDRLSRWIDDNDATDVIELIASESNGGFAAGNNIGIQSCDADFYLLLNSDTLLEDAAISRLLARAGTDPDSGLISPRLQWPDGTPQESCFRFHRPVSELIDGAATGPVTQLLSRYDVPIPVEDADSFPEWTSFACVLIRAEVFVDVGLLDEGFFMYFEDSEFCARARDAGWRVLHHPEARVVHLRGGSSPVKSQARAKKRLPRYFYESRTRYFYERYGRRGLLAANLMWTLGWSLSSVRAALQSRYQSPACEAQWRDIWIHFWDPLGPYTHPSGEATPRRTPRARQRR